MKTNARGAREDCIEMSDADVSEFQMSSDDRLDSEDEARSNSNHGVFQFGAKAMKLYQDEPLAISHLRPRMTEVGDGRVEIENPDSIPIATLKARYEIRYFVLQSMNCPLYIYNFSTSISEVRFTSCFPPFYSPDSALNKLQWLIL